MAEKVITWYLSHAIRIAYLSSRNCSTNTCFGLWAIRHINRVGINVVAKEQSTPKIWHFGAKKSPNNTI